jgi:hypothetical protein
VGGGGIDLGGIEFAGLGSAAGIQSGGTHSAGASTSSSSGGGRGSNETPSAPRTVAVVPVSEVGRSLSTGAL